MAKNKAAAPNTDTFTTASGLLLKLRRPDTFDVLSLDRQFMADKPPVPRRKTETAFGVEEVAISAPEPGTVDATWLEYEQALTLWSLTYGQQIMDFYLLEYVEVDVPARLPALERTYARMRRAGKQPPYDLADDDGRKLAYLRRNLADEESARLQLQLRRMMRPAQEAVAEIEAAFRGDLPEPTADG